MSLNLLKDSNFSDYIAKLNDRKFNSSISKAINELKFVMNELKSQQQVDLVKRIENAMLMITDETEEDTSFENYQESHHSEGGSELEFLHTFSKDYTKNINRSNAKLATKKFTLLKINKENSKKRGSVIETINEEEEKERIRSNSFVKLSSAMKVKEKLIHCTDFNFNIFELEALVKDSLMQVVTNHLFAKIGLFSNELLKEQSLIEFSKDISGGYNDVPYHNYIHAVDVTQTSFMLITTGNLIESLDLLDLDLMSLLIGAMCHDFKHNGLNNMYHENTLSDIAIESNDISILESYHARESFKVIQKHNLLSNLDKPSFKIFRKRFIECIMATDMANHTIHLNQLRNKMNLYDIKNGENVNKLKSNDKTFFDNQQQILNICIHSSDVSNPTKPYIVYKKWVGLVFEEFFNQGDLERKAGLPITVLCDRLNTSVPKSQIGFITYVVKPTFDILMDLSPGVKPYCDNIKLNLDLYEELVLEEQKKQS